jgi:hypothetical protein
VDDICFEDTNRSEVLGQATFRKLTRKIVFVKQVGSVLFMYCMRKNEECLILSDFTADK